MKEEYRSYSQEERHEMKPSSKIRYNIILKLIKKYNMSGSLMDIGCGGGNLLRRISSKYPERFEKLHGIDCREIKLTKGFKDRGIYIFKSDITKPHDFNDKYDVIVCSEVLEHITNWKRAVENIKNLLKEDGKVIITVPFLKENWTKHDAAVGHLRRFGYKQIETYLEKLNFKILESFGWGTILYRFYCNLILNKIKPEILDQNVMVRNKNIYIEKGKKGVSNILYALYHLDTLFTKKRVGELFLSLLKGGIYMNWKETGKSM